MAAKRLELRVHWFYPTSLHYFEMPDDLFEMFRAADFVILKGDVNYRPSRRRRALETDDEF